MSGAWIPSPLPTPSYPARPSCSGLLTIGPRFGGAIDDAARYFKQACDQVGFGIHMVWCFGRGVVIGMGMGMVYGCVVVGSAA